MNMNVYKTKYDFEECFMKMMKKSGNPKNKN